MVITSGNVEHISKLVRRIRTFYLNEKKEENHWIIAGVIKRGAGGETLTDELLDLLPSMHVARVKESAEQQAAGNKYMDQPRKEAREYWSHRVELYVLHSGICRKFIVMTLLHDLCDKSDICTPAKYGMTRQDAFSNSASQPYKGLLPFLPSFPNASCSSTTIISSMPVTRSSPPRSSHPSGPSSLFNVSSRPSKATSKPKPQARPQRAPSSSPEPEPEPRKLTKAEAEIQEAFKKWSNKILTGTTPSSGPRHPFYNIGTHWMRFIDAWTDKIELVMRFSFSEDLKAQQEEDNDDIDIDIDINHDDNKEPLSKEEREEQLKVLNLFVLPDEMKESNKDNYRRMFDMFKAKHAMQYKQMLGCYEFQAMDTIRVLYLSIEHSYRDARRMDTHNMKQRILTFIPHNNQQLQLKDGALDPFMDPNTKSGCGLSHNIIIPLLAPISCVKETIDKASDDPIRLKLIKEAKAGKIVFTHEEAPGFLYDLSRFFNDPDKSGKAGLFRGYIIPRASSTILMLPSSALGQKQATRAGNAKIAGVTSVTKEFLTYIIIQIWFMLSSGQEWDETIGSFNLKAFYYAMIAAYDNLNHLRIKQMTKWLNNQIWGENHVVQGVAPDSCLGKDMALWAMEVDKDVEPEDDEPSSGPPSSDDSSSPGIGSGSGTADPGTAGSGTAGPDSAGPGNAGTSTGGDA
ncbi:hypothetical protein PM082_009034 [Marasmius tenuissimus]|nr:hypothetical protein PM082_009034 [Marasmius tenuissimus]